LWNLKCSSCMCYHVKGSQVIHDIPEPHGARLPSESLQSSSTGSRVVGSHLPSTHMSHVSVSRVHSRGDWTLFNYAADISISDNVMPLNTEAKPQTPLVQYINCWMSNNLGETNITVILMSHSYMSLVSTTYRLIVRTADDLMLQHLTSSHIARYPSEDMVQLLTVWWGDGHIFTT